MNRGRDRLIIQIRAEREEGESRKKKMQRRRERERGGDLLTAVLAWLLKGHFQRKHHSESKIIPILCQDHGSLEDTQ